jgi:hypothetical protein
VPDISAASVITGKRVPMICDEKWTHITGGDRRCDGMQFLSTAIHCSQQTEEKSSVFIV